MYRATTNERDVENAVRISNVIDDDTAEPKGDDIIVEHSYDPPLLDPWGKLPIIEEIEINGVTEER